MNHQTTENSAIEIQRKRSFTAPPKLDIIEACKVKKGILKLSPAEKNKFIELYNNINPVSTFFIPASGSGSRMFEFLFKFLTTPDDENQSKVERFINHFEDFAFSKRVNPEVLNSLKKGKISIETFIDYLLSNDGGLNLAHLPKGLIPFHRIGPFILTPFQSHIAQGIEITQGSPIFHFTINKNFIDAIKQEQKNIENLTSKSAQINYSEQDPKTNAYIFDENQELIVDQNNNPITRPAGHGALLENLAKIQSDIIFVKNIDNLQHYNKCSYTKESFQLIGGLLITIEKERNQLLSDFSLEKFHIFNSKYEILIPEELDDLSEEQIKATLNLPIRICGMVKNEGEPGGGPFWLKSNGVTRKQIIEKAQISRTDKQYSLLINSTHFNPVFMALKNTDKDSNPFDLKALVDDNQYLRVKKSYKGKKIFFTEKPGLWNGSMHNWLTVFVEIPSETFSPVKTILDLLNPIHKES